MQGAVVMVDDLFTAVVRCLWEAVQVQSCMLVLHCHLCNIVVPLFDVIAGMNPVP